MHFASLQGPSYIAIGISYAPACVRPSREAGISTHPRPLHPVSLPIVHLRSTQREWLRGHNLRHIDILGRSQIQKGELAMQCNAIRTGCEKVDHTQASTPGRHCRRERERENIGKIFAHFYILEAFRRTYKASPFFRRHVDRSVH